MFVSISQVIGCEERLRKDLYCVEWGVKLYSIHPVDMHTYSKLLCSVMHKYRVTVHYKSLQYCFAWDQYVIPSPILVPQVAFYLEWLHCYGHLNLCYFFAPLCRNYASVLYRFQDIASHLWNVANFCLPLPYLEPPMGETRVDFYRDFGGQKTRGKVLS